LPELWNVLRGDMSLVGPRPLPTEYLPRYSAEQARRHDVRPGITGWAQVNGRNGLTWERQFELDLWYIEHASFLLDLKILILTFYAVLRRKEINASETVTRPPLKEINARQKLILKRHKVAIPHRRVIFIS
jgi:lipopolysaccharide/colanic/teichoic acid biosynthesis glycosyltransferase